MNIHVVKLTTAIFRSGMVSLGIVTLILIFMLYALPVFTLQRQDKKAKLCINLLI
jgi:hypothetical protein